MRNLNLFENESEFEDLNKFFFSNRNFNDDFSNEKRYLQFDDKTDYWKIFEIKTKKLKCEIWNQNESEIHANNKEILYFSIWIKISLIWYHDRTMWNI